MTDGCPETSTSQLLTICERMRDEQEDFRQRLCGTLRLEYTTATEDDILERIVQLKLMAFRKGDDGK